MFLKIIAKSLSKPILVDLLQNVIIALLKENIPLRSPSLTTQGFKISILPEHLDKVKCLVQIIIDKNQQLEALFNSPEVSQGQYKPAEWQDIETIYDVPQLILTYSFREKRKK